MKKLLLLLFIFPSIFGACSDDNDDVDYSSSPILGTWEFAKVELKEVNVSKPELITAITNDIKNDSDNANFTMTFTKSGKVSYVMGKESSMHGTYTINGNKLTYTLAGGTIIFAEIAILGNTLTMLTDVTKYYQNKEVLEKLVSTEIAKDAVVNEITTLETFIKK